MKNEKLIASWDRILPDETAVERMRSKIMEYQRSYQGKAQVNAMKKLLPVTACLLLVFAVASFRSIQHDRFGTKPYTVTLDNGETLIYGKSSPKGEACYAYDYEIKDRALTSDELHILFPSIANIEENGYPYGTFKADTDELLRLEITVDDINIHLAKTGLPLTDDIVVGEENSTNVCGTTVKTGFSLTKPNSKGIKHIIFFSEFTINETSVYLELAGNENDSDHLSKKLSDTLYSMINTNTPDISAIRYE